MRIKSITPRYFSDLRYPERENMDEAGDAMAAAERHPEYMRGAFSFTCLKYHPGDGLIYCGTTNFGNNVFQSFDPKTKKFRSLDYAKFGQDRFEVKIHRSLDVGSDGRLYGACSCLYNPSYRLQAPGGKLFAYDPARGVYENLGIPKKHDYIQTISLDAKRGMIYGFTYPVFDFFAYSIPERRVKYIQYMESIPHLSAVDDAGGYWGTWGHRHNLFRYDPAGNSVKFFDKGFPFKCQSLMYPNAGPIDMALNAGNGEYYVTSEMGELYRLDTGTADLHYLGRPFAFPRLPGLCLGPNGLLFGAGGSKWNTRLCSYDREKNNFTDLGPIKDPATGEVCFRPHDLICVGNTLYLGETDNPRRSGYLWEIELGA